MQTKTATYTSDKPSLTYWKIPRPETTAQIPEADLTKLATQQHLSMDTSKIDELDFAEVKADLEAIYHSLSNTKAVAQYLRHLSRSESQIANLYKIAEKTELNLALLNNAAVEEVLTETAQKIKEYFGEEIVPTLGLADYQDLDEPELFVIRIPVNDESEVALNKLNDFDDSWWLKNSRRANGRIIVTLEYV